MGHWGYSYCKVSGEGQRKGYVGISLGRISEDNRRKCQWWESHRDGSVRSINGEGHRNGQ